MMNEETKYLINEVVGYIDIAKRCGKSSEYYFYWLGVARGCIFAALRDYSVDRCIIGRLNKTIAKKAFLVVRLP